MLDFFKCLIVELVALVVVEYKLYLLDVYEKACVASGARDKARLAQF